MRIQSMKSVHKIRKFRHGPSGSWKDERISAAYHKNLEHSGDVSSPEEFMSLMKYMNEWLNHPLYPKFI